MVIILHKQPGPSRDQWLYIEQSAPPVTIFYKEIFIVITHTAKYLMHFYMSTSFYINIPWPPDSHIEYFHHITKKAP